MCSRFAVHDDEDWETVLEMIRGVGWREPIVSVIRQDAGQVILEPGYRWWLVPGWWKKDLKEVPTTFNARGEECAGKPMFRSAFKSRRCLIPAACFFEWAKPEKVKTQIGRADGHPLLFAGLWEEWRPAEGESLRSCTIITTTPNAVMEPIHNRMPVILGPEEWREWLDPETPAAQLQHLLRPCPDEWLVARPV